MGRRLARVAAGRMLAQVRYVAPVQPDQARGVVAEVYAQLRKDFGMLAPPVVLHSPAPGPLAAAWVMLRETLLATGEVARTTKEVVAAAVSVANACPYCVEVHTTSLRGLVRSRTAAAVAAGRPADIPDADLRAIATWAGQTGTGQRPPARIPVRQIVELVGVAVTFHYLNRMVNAFLVRSPLPAGLPDGLRAGVRQLAGWLLAPTMRRHRMPGAALPLLPTAPLPPIWSWSADHPTIADAFGRAAGAVERAAARSVPRAVRELITARLARWDTQPAALDRSWLDEALTDLPNALRAAGRLALLTAFAPYQIGPTVIEAYRREGADDEAVMTLASWAALAASARIGSALAGPQGLGKVVN